MMEEKLENLWKGFDYNDYHVITIHYLIISNFIDQIITIFFYY
jgi:hypothetical protein